MIMRRPLSRVVFCVHGQPLFFCGFFYCGFKISATSLCHSARRTVNDFFAVTPSYLRAKIPRHYAAKAPPNPNEGHRGRLRDKFLRAGLSSLNDYEVVELLLSLGTPRTDCKERAKEAIKHFKGLRRSPGGFFRTSCREVKGIGPKKRHRCSPGTRRLANQYLKEKAKRIPGLQLAIPVKNYLFHEMQGLKKEVFKVLFLDSRNRLMEAEDLFHGTV